jgi:hypothetical protein
MSATKTVGFVVLIGVGLYGVYYLLTKKLEAAEGKAASQIDAIGAGLKSSVAGIVGMAGAGLKSLAGGIGVSKAAWPAAGSAAAAKAAFIGPMQPAVTGTGFTGSAGAVGIGGAILTGAMIVYAAFHRLFPGSDPEQEAIDRRLQEARDRGELILTSVRKSQLKAPVR